jgi:hypothetical protein
VALRHDEITDIARARRVYRGEELFFDVLEEHSHRAVRAAFIELGISPSVAANLVFFIDDQRHLDRHQDEATRGRYRKILRDLDPAKVREFASNTIGGLFNSDEFEAA